MTLPGVNVALAAAVRKVNAAYFRLPADSRRPEAAEFDSLEAEVDAACQAGDRERALRAIADWQQHWLRRFEGATV